MNPYGFAFQMSRDGEKFFHTLAKKVKRPGLPSPRDKEGRGWNEQAVRIV